MFQALTERLASQMVEYKLCIPPRFQGRLRSVLFNMKSIRQEEYDTEGNLLIDIRMQQADWARLQKREEVELDDFIVV